MKIPFFSFDKRNRDIRSSAISAFKTFFDSKWYVLGKGTAEFEEAYANFNRTKHAIGVSSGLDALHLCLLALDIGEGDDIIVPSNTYIATVLAITYTGANPVFVEPRYTTSNINPDLVERAITEKTKAIMPVHLYGQSCEMDKIMKVAEDNNLYVVEDNAQSQGAKYKGKITGSFGHVNATSFYPTKNIGALGEAGAVTTDDAGLAEKISMLRNYGSKITYYNDLLGYNDRIDEYETYFLKESLNYFDQWTKERIDIHNMYLHYLADITEIEINEVATNATTVNHLFTIKTDKRDDVQKFLTDRGVGTKIHYPVPPHLQNCYKYLGYKEGDFPVAEKLAKRTLSLPNYLGLSEVEVKYVTSVIKAYFTK